MALKGLRYSEQSDLFKKFLKEHRFEYLEDFNRDIDRHMGKAKVSYSTLRDIYTGKVGIPLKLYEFMRRRYKFELTDWTDALPEVIHVDPVTEANRQLSLGIREDRMLERKLSR